MESTATANTPTCYISSSDSSPGPENLDEKLGYNILHPTHESSTAGLLHRVEGQASGFEHLEERTQCLSTGAVPNAPTKSDHGHHTGKHRTRKHRSGHEFCGGDAGPPLQGAKTTSKAVCQGVNKVLISFWLQTM